jgi:CRISPR type I-D-associated protein Csc3/Cas10d
MSRPRLDAEQKKVSFSLAFSPNLIAALEKVRGAKSQSVFVEEWLRQHPQIAAALLAMNDPGFVPPVLRYEQLMERLLAFYSPGESTSSLRNERVATIPQTLLVAQKAIILHQKSPDEDSAEQISAAMEAFWLRERRNHGERIARGESLEAIRPAIEEFARYYYLVIFQELAKGDLTLLQHRFRSLMHGCEAVYREHMHKAGEQRDQ